MAARAAEVVAVFAVVTAVTAVIAAPVLRAPSDRVFGMATVGRHHDPFTVMQQLERPIMLYAQLQPATDIPAAGLARIVGAVAAYNVVVLWSFPFAAAVAYALARHLAIGRFGAVVAAMTFAFSPFHIAHAAYHPHIAQIQWLPLYLLALWRCLDRAAPWATGLLVVAALAVMLTNFYGGLIAAVISPVAVTGYWLAASRWRAHALRQLATTVGALAVVACAGMGYAIYVFGPDLRFDSTALAAPSNDVFLHSATMWSYVIPPLTHPWFGSWVEQFWAGAGISAGLLEHQLSLGWSVTALALIAIARWAVSKQGTEPIVFTPMLVSLAAAAWLCSTWPPDLLHEVVPMFRAYARFGLVVQLMAVLLAGLAIEWLWSLNTRRAHMLCVTLLLICVGEYIVAPWSLWRDVLPTTAHRWTMQQPDARLVLDCTLLDQESQSVQWLTHGRVRLLQGRFDDCAEPDLPKKLAANGYTHVLARTGATLSGEEFAVEGISPAAQFDDGQVFAVTERAPIVYTAALSDFFPREFHARSSWRWMAADAAWSVVNTHSGPITATLDIELAAFPRMRHLELRLDAHSVQVLAVERSLRDYRVGPLTLSPGEHSLAFHAVEAPSVADEVHDNGDKRALSFAVGKWTWTVGGGRQ